MINYSLFSPWPSFSQEEINAVKEVLLSNKVNYWTGNECKKFEKEFASFCGAKYAVVLANGTVALDLALKACGIGVGDEVVVTPRTFIASVTCVVNAGAIPVFADIDLNSGNINSKSIQSVLTSKTKAIICVHLAGWPCEMDEIMNLAKENNLKVIEDCSQAHGAKYKGKSVGSIGDIGTWSFCQDKIITTGGEGGMVTTNNHNLWSKMWSYKDHGKSYDAMEQSKTKGFNWVHHSFGTNARMTEMQAAIGRIQLKKLNNWHKKRANNAMKIMQFCSNIKGLRVPKIPKHIEHAFYKCYIFLEFNKLKKIKSQQQAIDAINRFNIPCYVGSCSEIYLEKAFENTNLRPQIRLTNAKQLGETSLMFLCHPTLTNREIEHTCKAIQQVIN